MTTNSTGGDDVIVRDGSGRRRFIRAGTALLLGGTALAARAQESAFSDCDRAVYREDEKNPKQAANGSDSDTGAGADPSGCGQRRYDPPAISRAEPADGLPRVAKVRG